MHIDMRIDAGVPYWRLSDEQRRGDASVVYVWKSFGDEHTSAPVEAHESERAGRVRFSSTSCEQ